MQTILLVLQIILAVFLIGLVLIQRSDDSSMGGLGGNAGGNGFMSRRSAGNFLTKMTAIIAFLFALTSLGLTLTAKKQTQSVSLLTHLNMTQPNPISVPADVLSEEQVPTAGDTTSSSQTESSQTQP